MSGTHVLLICEKASSLSPPIALRNSDPCPWCGKAQLEHRKMRHEKKLEIVVVPTPDEEVNGA